GEPGVDIRLELIGELSETRPFGRRNVAERLQERGEDPAFAREIAVADRAQVCLPAGGSEVLLEPGADFLNLSRGIGHTPAGVPRRPPWPGAQTPPGWSRPDPRGSCDRSDCRPP